MATTLTQSRYAGLDLASIVDLVAIQVGKSEKLFQKSAKGGLFINSKAITDLDTSQLEPLVPVQNAKRPLIRDAQEAAVCGAFLVPDGEKKLENSLKRLVHAIDAKLKENFGGVLIRDLVRIDAAELTQIIGRQLGGASAALESGKTLATEVFRAGVSQAFPASHPDIRLLKGVISFKAVELTERIAAAVDRAIRNQHGLDEDEIEDASTDFKKYRLREDSDPTRIHFLVKTIQEKAMGRVEREIGANLLVRLCEAATAHTSFSELSAYGMNVKGLASLGISEGVEDREFELPLAGFGVSDNFRFRKEMMLGSAFDALPIRVVGSGFISDEIFGEGELQRIANSYHVNLNGPVAFSEGVSHKSALLYRLAQIREAVDSQTEDHQKRLLARKAMRNLSTLWLCLPDQKTDSLLDRFQRLKKLLGTGRPGIETALAELETRCDMVDRMVERLHSILKDRKEILGNLEHEPLVLHLGLHKSILDPEGLKRGLPFKSLSPEKEEVQVLEHISVSTGTPTGMLVSFPFSVQISEQWVSRLSVDPTHQFEFRRELPQNMAYLMAYPGKDITNAGKVRFNDWRSESSRGIYLSFDPAANRRIGDGIDPISVGVPVIRGIIHQIFVFVALRRILEYSGTEGLPVVALRLQQSNGPDEAIYHQLKTIEFALGDRNPVSSQGMTLETENLAFRRKAAAWGLLSDLPAFLKTGTRASVDKVAIVSMAGRATDQLRNALGPIHSPDDGHGLFGEILTFDASDEGWSIHNPRRFAYSGRRSDNLVTMRAVKTEIERLASNGYRKILFIAREFQSPRFGLTGKDRRPYLTPEVFDALAKEIEGCDIYPLVKGSYDGVRVGNLKTHQTIYHLGEGLSPGVKSAIAPFLTIANLRWVGKVRKTTHSRCTTYYVATGAYSDPEHNARLTSELLSKGPMQETLLSVLLGLHFFRYEKVPEAVGKEFVIGSKLDPFSALTGTPSIAAHSESVSLPTSRRSQVKVAMLPILNRIGSMMDLIPVGNEGAPNA